MRPLPLVIPVVLFAGFTSSCPGESKPAPAEERVEKDAQEGLDDAVIDAESIERAAREAAERITPENAEEELQKLELELEIIDSFGETGAAPH